MTVRVDHVLVTRFNLPSTGTESLIRAQEGWLRERIALFLTYTVPSVLRQRAPVRWLVYLDPESPDWLVDRLQPLADDEVLIPVFRETVPPPALVADAQRATGAGGDVLLTTNLDNDDAVAVDFAERLQRLAKPAGRRAIYLADGLVARGPRLYRRRDRHNAFVSVAEPWDDPMTAWADWHTMLHRHMPVIVERGDPAWLQVVHARNVSNRVRGHLTDPARWRHRFPGALDDVAPVTRGALALDAALRRPVREARELPRAAAKQLLMAVGGKDALDAVKQRMRTGSRSSAS